MSAHNLLNILNKMGKRDKMQGLPSIYLFFTTSLINSIIRKHKCKILLSHDIKITKKSHIWEIFKVLPSFTQHYNGCHYIKH